MTKPDEPRVIFTLTLYERPAMSAAIQVHQVKDALHQAIAEIGGPNGRALRDQLLGAFDQDSMMRPVLGDYEFSPTAPPA